MFFDCEMILGLEKSWSVCRGCYGGLLTHRRGGGALIERDRGPVVPAGRQPITITLNLENFQTSLLRF